MNRKYTLVFLTIIVFLVFFNTDVEAQCAMCKKVAEGKGNANVAKHLNTAILYLMAAPYLLMTFFFRKQIGSVFNRVKAKLFPAKTIS